MHSNHRGAEPSAREIQPPIDEGRATVARAVATRARPQWHVAGIAMLTSLAMALLVMGCGRDSLESTDRSSQTDPGGIAVPASVPVQPPAGSAQQASVPEAAADRSNGSEPVSQGVAPDVAVSAVDTLVAPGEIVELTAEATADVVELTLWDGRGVRQPFAYDSTARLWHATYRVPLRSSADRIGLSVTAKTEAKRWRRVWVFLKIAP